MSRKQKPNAIRASAVTQKVQLVQSKNMPLVCSIFPITGMGAFAASAGLTALAAPRKSVPDRRRSREGSGGVLRKLPPVRTRAERASDGAAGSATSRKDPLSPNNGYGRESSQD